MKYLIGVIVLALLGYIVVNFDTLKEPHGGFIKGAETLTNNKPVEYEMKGFPSNLGGGILGGSTDPYQKLEEEKDKRAYWQ